MRLLRMTLITGMGGLSLATALLIMPSSQSLSKTSQKPTKITPAPMKAAAISTTTVRPTPATEVPNVIPAKGVLINTNQALLFPPKINNPSISRMQALVIAKSYDNAPGLSVTSVKLTDFTFPGSIPGPGTTVPFCTLEHVPAWVVTFTTPTPVNVSQAPTGVPVYVAYDNLVINAQTGSFVVGFFTK